MIPLPDPLGNGSQRHVLDAEPHTLHVMVELYIPIFRAKRLLRVAADGDNRCILEPIPLVKGLAFDLFSIFSRLGHDPSVELILHLCQLVG